jgi:hypothetical protein
VKITADLRRKVNTLWKPQKHSLRRNYNLKSMTLI